MKSRIILFLLVLSSVSLAQMETDKWEKVENPYLQRFIGDDEDYKSSGTVTGFVVKPVIFIYRFFISDQDGDNCPFYPSCSHFFVESVEKTNIFQGSLMFADRFTRDMNIFNRSAKYPVVYKQRLYDPPELYTLGQAEYSPPPR
jgi:putative component of membrane protein insertase Oxa1/YidC/SpoIIIJ protein YidD